MNLWFRFLKVIWLSRWAKRIGVLQDSRLYFRTWPFDLDFNLHMNNGRFLTIMDLGRMDLMLKMGIFSVIWKESWMPVVGSVHIVFRRSLKPFQHFELQTRVVYWEPKWFYMEQEFYAGGRLYARALVKASFKAPDGVVPTERAVGLIGATASSPTMPERWKGIIENDRELHLEEKAL